MLRKSRNAAEVSRIIRTARNEASFLSAVRSLCSQKLELLAESRKHSSTSRSTSGSAVRRHHAHVCAFTGQAIGEPCGHGGECASGWIPGRGCGAVSGPGAAGTPQGGAARRGVGGVPGSHIPGAAAICGSCRGRARAGWRQRRRLQLVERQRLQLVERHRLREEDAFRRRRLSPHRKTTLRPETGSSNRRMRNLKRSLRSTK